MPSRMPGGRRGPRRALASVAGLVIAVGLALTGCEPAAGGPAAATPPAPPAVTTPVAAPATTPAPAPPAVPATPPPAPAATEAPAPVTQAPAPAKAPVAPPAPAAPSAPKATPTPKAAPTTPAAPAAACEIVSDAGNCYKAGQFCRKADAGRSTHDAGGRMLTCRMVSGQLHWQAD